MDQSVSHMFGRIQSSGFEVSLFLCGGLILASGCQAEEPANVLSLPDELVVLTRNAPTTYFLDRDAEVSGPEYDMMSAFAASIQLPVRFEVFDSVEEVLAALEEGRGHLAAAGLTWTEDRASRFLAGPSYQTVEEQVICSPRVQVDSLSDLARLEIAVSANSSYEATLEAVSPGVPGLTWESVSNKAIEQLIYEVAEDSLQCTLADSNIVAIHQRYMPRIETPLVIGSEKELVWMLAPEQASLLEPIHTWFEAYEASGELANTMNRHYGYLDQFDPYDTEVFVRRVEDELPQYRSLFETVAEETQLPWTLLAALSYQESHWEPTATSPTGVRGMMMLTEITAESMGVTDRTDPGQSVDGGARYLRQRVERIPAYVSESDRIWMGLAAYNVGEGHLRDARMLAVRFGENPNTWAGVKEVLPLLSQRQYYSDLPAGYGRGLQAVIYVERVRNYRDILESLLEEASPDTPRFGTVE